MFEKPSTLEAAVALVMATAAMGAIHVVDAAGQAARATSSAPSRPRLFTTTAGNIVLTGELTGDFVVLDARTGDVLYRFNTGGPIGGGVVTYARGGQQYVAVTSGSPSGFWVDRNNAGSPTILVFALPKN